MSEVPAGATPDYGIDAPGIRRGMALAGIGGAIFCAFAALLSARLGGAAATLSGWMASGAVMVALYGFGMGGYMTYGSRIGKRRDRERLLDLAGAVAPWTGREIVLDVGCGRGLMLVGAARRLTTGVAVGVDVWRSEDQAANAPDVPFENARREGVADRVRVATADARALPFADARFDAVLSHWVVHNIPGAADRALVLDEMLRVLRPGGVLVLADIAYHEAYRTRLVASGLTDLHVLDGGLEAAVAGVLSGGSFRPKAIVGRRAG